MLYWARSQNIAKTGFYKGGVFGGEINYEIRKYILYIKLAFHLLSIKL